MSAVTPVRQQQPDPPKRKRAKRVAALQDQRVRRTPPAPDAVLGQPGRPLEPGVRRAMEERLGHDFGAVRIHSDRDAAALAELIGADAVAVGKDIFFAEGAYRPETAQGLRLLAHELLHTVQVPDAPGRLRLGRDDGALSRPLDGVEREAEARVAEEPRPDAAAEVAERGAQPVSWLRFISIDVSQLRTEQLDPATVVDRIVAGVVRSLRGDPTDASGRVRQQLVRLAPELRSTVLGRLEKRLPSAEYLRIQQLVAAVDTAAGAPVDTPVTPEPVVEPTDRAETQRREHAEQQTGDDRQAEDRKGDSHDEDRQAAEDRKQEKAGEEKAEAERKKGAALDDQRKKDSEEEDKQKREDAEHQKAQEEKAAKKDGTDGTKKDGKEGEEAPNGEQTAAGQPAGAAGEQQPAAAAPAAEPASPLGGDAGPIGQAPVVGASTAPAAAVGTGGAEPVREDRAEDVARDPQGPLAKHELLREQGRQDEPPEQEKPQETEAGAESEVATPEAAAEPAPAEATVDRAEREAGEDKPRPDPVPKTDPDLSPVPTADEDLKLPSSGTPPKPREAPSLPAPPPVEAEPAALDSADRAEQAAEPELTRDEADTPQDKAVDAQAERAERAADEPAAADTGGTAAVPAEPAPTPAADTAALATAPAPAPSTAPAGGAITGASAGPAAASAPAAAGPAPMAANAAPTATAAPSAAVADSETGAAGPEARTPGEPGVSEPVPSEPMPGDPQLAEPGPGAAPGQPAAPGAAGAEARPGAGPEGSLEAGGGGCAGAPESTTEAGQGGEGGGCGGGGGAPAPAEQKAEAQPPDVSGQEPRAALSTISSQPPARMPQALGGVDQAVGTTVGQEHQDLQAAPPALDRPTGAPQTLSGAPRVGAPVATPTEPMAAVTPESLAKQREANPPPTANTPNPADRVQAPVVAGGNQDQATDAEIQQMQGAVNGVPTSDGRLFTTVGAAPKVKLEGETDPALADEQHRQTGERISQTHALGRQDSAVGLGEDQVYPNVPGETLTASVPGRTPAGGGPAAGAGAGGGLDPDTVSAVAVQERGPQIQAGYADGQAKMGQAQQDKQSQSDEARADNKAKVEQAVAENSDQQAAERQRAKEDAAGKRGEWRVEQDKAVEENTKDADAKHLKAREDTSAKKTEADADIEKRKAEDNDKIEKERKESEEKARKQREAKKEESSGWWGWVKSKVKAAFNALVSAIKGLFDLAVKAINAIKEGFKKAINGLIDLAAKAITGIIKGLANALLAVVSVIGTVFPGIAEKMRKAIISMRDAAIAKVQQLAEGLRKAVNALIDALAGALVAVLRLYEKLLLAAVEVVRGVVMAAIEFVESAIKLLGELAALIKDIAPDPIGWIRKFGAAARDGIRNFLWGAIKTAVKEWFNAKVEAVIGIGKLLWNVLVKGCMSVAQIGKMAWQAIVKSLPAMIISIVIEKVISMLIPAAGGIIAIAQGVMAAYQSISRIIAAFSAFLTFLKAVKAGGVAAACLFAKAVAAGAVALLEFITNFLMVRIAGALKGVGSKLKGIAEKIMKGLGRGAKAVKKAAGRTINAARQAVRGGVAAVKRGAVASARAVRRGVTAGARAVKSGVRRVGGAAKNGMRGAATGVRRAATAVGRTVAPALKTVSRTMKRLGSKLANSKLGRAIAKSAKSLKNLVKRGKQKFKDWRKKVADRRKQRKADKKKKPQESKETRLARIVERIKPKLKWLLDRGVGRGAFTGALSGMRVWYRLSRLIASHARHFNVRAWLNPVAAVIDGIEFDPKALLNFLHRLAKAIVQAGQRSGSADVERSKAHSRTKRRLTPEEETQLHPKKQRELIEVRPGARGHDVHAAIARDPKANPGTQSIVRYLDEGRGYSHDVKRKQGGRWITDPESKKRIKVGDYPENQLVLMEDPKSGRLRALNYPELTAKIAGNDARTQRVIAAGALSRLQGKPPIGPTAGISDELSTWLVHAEGRRNPAALATSALALDSVANSPAGHAAPDLAQVSRDLPMSPASAQQSARDLDKALNDPKKSLDSAPAKVRNLAQAEINVIKLWVETLNILTDDDKSAADVQRRLETAIENRLFTIYALTPAEREYVRREVGSR